MLQSEHYQKGFTLLEIIVALAIAAVGIAAAARYTVSASTVAFETEQRMLAVWTAGNRLTKLRIERAWPAPGSYNQQIEMGGRTWYLTETVSDTDHPNIRRVDIDVYTDPDQSDHEFNLYGYLARYLPPREQGPGGGAPDDGSEGLAGDEEGIPLPGDETQEVPLPGDEQQGVQESEIGTEPNEGQSTGETEQSGG